MKNRINTLFSAALLGGLLLTSSAVKAGSPSFGSPVYNNSTSGWHDNNPDHGWSYKGTQTYYDRYNNNDNRWDHDRDHDRNHDRDYYSHDYYDHDHDHDGYNRHGFSDHDKIIVRNYYYNYYQYPHYRRYVIGQPLPRTVRWTYLPPRLRSQLPPPPAYTNYVLVDNDVLLVSALNWVILDAIF